MQLEEFGRLNLHDIVRFQGQLHSIVHMNRRAGTAYLRPAPGWGRIVGPIDSGEILRVLAEAPAPLDPESRPVIRAARPPLDQTVVGRPGEAIRDQTIDGLPAVVRFDATVEGVPYEATVAGIPMAGCIDDPITGTAFHSGDTATEMVVPWLG